MRRAECLNLLSKKLNEENQVISKKDRKSIANHIVSSGVEAEQLPLIIDLVAKFYAGAQQPLKHGDIKQKIDCFVKTEQLSIAKAPQKKLVDGSRKQRRMDSLSRILSIEEKLSPCVAVALANNQLLLAYNTALNAETEQKIQEKLASKIQILRCFLLAVLPQEKELPTLKKIYGNNPMKIKLTSKARYQALKAASALSDKGSGAILPTTEKRNEHCQSLTAHIQTALLKIAISCLKAVLTSGKHSEFDLNQLHALLMSKPIFVPHPPNLELNLHAEQAIVEHLKTQEALTERPLPINIGISKLCCQACHSVLSQFQKEVSYRGTHDIHFPNVFNILSQARHEGIMTRMSTDMCPDDSDSEPEIEVDLPSQTHNSEQNLPKITIKRENPPLIRHPRYSGTFFAVERCHLKKNTGNPRYLSYPDRIKSLF